MSTATDKGAAETSTRDAIAAKARQLRQEEDLAHRKANGLPLPEGPEETSATEVTEPQESPEPPATEPPATEPPLEEDGDEVVLKVDGKEQRVPRRDVLEAGIRHLQKDQAASVRMQEANELAVRLQNYADTLTQRDRQLRQLAEDLKAKEAAISKAPEPSKSDALSEAATSELEEEVVAGIYSGDEERARAAVRKLIAAGRQAGQPTPTLDVKELENTVAAGVQARIEVQEARKAFAQEFADIQSDSVLFDLANKETAALKRDNPSWSPTQIVREAGLRVRRWRDTALGQRAPANTGKIQAKRSAADTVKVAGRRSEAPKVPAPKTPSEIVAQMKKLRGQTF